MLFAAVAYLEEGLSVDILSTLKAEKFLTFIFRTKRAIRCVTEHLVLFLKTLTRNKASSS
jgi:hypothetical protein